MPFSRHRFLMHSAAVRAIAGAVLLGLFAPRDAIAQRDTARPATAQEIKERVMRGTPEPVRAILGVADSLELGLSATQRGKLIQIADKYWRVVDSSGTLVADLVTAAGPNADMRALAPRMQAINGGVMAALRASMTEAQDILTPEQWAKLPERIRSPLAKTGRSP